MAILDDIIGERLRQHELRGSPDRPDGTGGGARQTWATQARNACDRALREGRLTFAHVFDEKTSAVLAEDDSVRLREELVQVAAACIQWIEALDRRKRDA